MEHKLVRIDVVSVAKIYGFITAALVGVFSFPFAFVDVIAPTGFGFATLVMLIVVSGITGALLGAIGPIVYNVLAGTVGGDRYTTRIQWFRYASYTETGRYWWRISHHPFPSATTCRSD